VGVLTTTAAQLQLCIQFAGTGSPTASIQQVHLDVDATPAITPSFASASSTSFTVGTAGSFTVTANGQPLPTITESGSLPSGVSFTGGTGSATLSGTPGSGTGGTYALTFTADLRARTLPVGLQTFMGEFIIRWDLLTAGGVITALPIVFFFMLVQRQLIAGLTAGAVKG
jgi:hypothetical protein